MNHSRSSRRHTVAATVAALVWTLATAALSPSISVAAKGDCGQPVSTGTGPKASDCAYVLKTAVNLVTCDLCVCDLNDSGTENTLDALICLKKAVGQQVTLGCPDCGGDTTTTIPDPGASTTSTSTTSTTTTIPIRCNNNGDCSGLPDGFRCNPNSDRCEKPCTRNADCKFEIFEECNKTTGYCQEPALIF